MSWAFIVLQFRLNTLPVLVQMVMMDRFTALRKHYKIIQIVRALWLAKKPFYMSVCKHGFRSFVWFCYVVVKSQFCLKSVSTTMLSVQFI